MFRTSVAARVFLHEADDIERTYPVGEVRSLAWICLALTLLAIALKIF